MCGLPHWVEISITRTDGPSYQVTLEGRTLTYQQWMSEAPRQTEQLHPAPREWREFLSALEAVDIRQWDSEYPAATPDPAVRWYIELAAPGYLLNTSGADVYPPGEAFPRFCEAMRALLGGREFG